MAMFLLTDATGIGSNDLDAGQGLIDLGIIANDTGFGANDAAGGQQLITYARTLTGVVQLRLDTLVNTTFTPDYGSGPQNVDIVIAAGTSAFVLDDGTSMANNGTSLPPSDSGLPGATLNPTLNNLVIYDTDQNVCVARDGTGGDLDLPESNPVILYHELSHSFRIVNNTLLALTGICDPAAPEENAAIIDENDLRTDIANRLGTAPELRDPDIHCGDVGCDSGCCIIATVASKSLTSQEVRSLRGVRDHFVRSTEMGHSFFEQFFQDYYSFSPQVCTFMARDPKLSGHLLEGWVNPLLDFWKIMIAYSRQSMTIEGAGAAFVRTQSGRAQAEARRDALRRTLTYWSHGGSDEDPWRVELLRLLQERAWPSEHIQWALVTPVRIYYDLITMYVDEAGTDAIGREFERAIDSWAPEMPISDVWAALSAEQVAAELAFCESVLFQTARSRQRFAQRLRDRFNHITSIAVVLNGREQQPGGGS
ncbi:MAG TPA: hypothetical protein VGF13_15485 [Verrucomicrobiae bacterium]